MLEKLAENHLSLDAFSHLSDCRIAANGLDVKCWKGRPSGGFTVQWDQYLMGRESLRGN